MNGDMDGREPGLENELRSLRPMPLSDRAHGRILSAMNRGAGRAGFSRSRRLALAALAASVVAAAIGSLWIGHRVSPGPETAQPCAAPAPEIHPFAAGTLLVKQEDQGVVCLGKYPARKFRRVFLDSVAWRNPGDDFVTVAMRPREELAYVAMSAY